jgi:DNA-binding NtrC family response regulator
MMGALQSNYSGHLPMSRKKRILCISYDEHLLTTRKMILENEGFDVATACGFGEASQACDSCPVFDLVLLGQTIPIADKNNLVQIFRRNSSSPILSIRRQDEPLMPDTEYVVESLAGPNALIDAVRKALGESQSASFA